LVYGEAHSSGVGDVSIRGSNGTNKGKIDFYTSGAPQVTIAADGSVGIGVDASTLNNDPLFAVNGAIGVNPNLIQFMSSDMGDNSDVSMWIGKAKSNNQSMGIGYHYDTTEADCYAWFGCHHHDTPGTHTINVRDGGNVGIGTGLPQQQLHLAKSNAYIYMESTYAGVTHGAMGSEIDFIGTDGARAAIAGIRGAHDGTATDHSGMLRFYTTSGNGIGSLYASSNGAERMRIDRNGYVYFYGTGANFASGVNFATTGRFSDSSKDTSSPATAIASYHLTFFPPDATGYYGNNIGFSEGANVAAFISAFDEGSGGALGLSFGTGSNSAVAERIRIDRYGNTIDKHSHSSAVALSSGQSAKWQYTGTIQNATGNLDLHMFTGQDTTTGRVVVSWDSSGGVRWSTVVDFGYSDGDLATHTPLNGSSQSTASVSILVDTPNAGDISLRLVYSGGVGGTTRFAVTAWANTVAY